MKTHTAWENPELRTAYLARQLNRNAMGLVLGAGISKGFGLPEWDELLDSMYKGHEQHRPKGKSAQIQADHFRRVVCEGNQQKYLDCVSSALYENYNADLDQLQKNATLGSIAALVMSSARGHASSVITFNFDDILERYLEYHGFVVESVPDVPRWSSSADVEVFHPHGLLPAPGSNRRKKSKEIVFSRTEFIEALTENDDPKRHQLLVAMRSRTCLFLGVSGNDDHQLALMKIVKESHAANSTKTLYWGVWISADQMALEAKDEWKKQGIFPLGIKNWDELPKQLYQIAQQAARQRGE